MRDKQEKWCFRIWFHFLIDQRCVFVHQTHRIQRWEPGSYTYSTMWAYKRPTCSDAWSQPYHPVGSNGNELVVSLIVSTSFDWEMIRSWLSNSAHVVKTGIRKTMVGCCFLSMCFVLTMFEPFVRPGWWTFYRLHKLYLTETVRSRGSVLNSVLQGQGKGKHFKGCSDDLQLVICMTTCPMAQEELHIYWKYLAKEDAGNAV